MVICRYYLRGECWFGNKCRNEHVRSGSPSYNEPEFTSSNRYSALQHNEYRQQPGKSVSWDNQYGRYRGSSSYEDDSNVRESRSRYTWTASQSRKPEPQDKAVSFSFTKALAQTNRPQSSDNQPQWRKSDMPSRFDDDSASFLKEEALTWERGKQWLFTCYAPANSKMCFPGFDDFSPEEMRWLAYQNASNFSLYVQIIQDATKEFQARRDKLKNPSSEILQVFKILREGKDPVNLPLVPGVFQTILANSPLGFSNENNPVVNASNFGSSQQSSEVASHLFTSNAPLISPLPQPSLVEEVMCDAEEQQMPSASAENIQPALPASSPKIQIPTTTTITTLVKPSQPSAMNTQDDYTGIYTPAEKLSDKDKEQFKAQRFILGQIPTKPPAREFC